MGCAKKTGTQTKSPNRLSMIASNVAARHVGGAGKIHQRRPGGKPRRDHGRRIRGVGEMRGAECHACRAEKNLRHPKRTVACHHRHDGRIGLAAEHRIENPHTDHRRQRFAQTVPGSNDQGLEKNGPRPRHDPNQSVHRDNNRADRRRAPKKQAGAHRQQDRPQSIGPDFPPGKRGRKWRKDRREVAVDQTEDGEPCDGDSEQSMAEPRYFHAKTSRGDQVSNRSVRHRSRRAGSSSRGARPFLARWALRALSFFALCRRIGPPAAMLAALPLNSSSRTGPSTPSTATTVRVPFAPT